MSNKNKKGRYFNNANNKSDDRKCTKGRRDRGNYNEATNDDLKGKTSAKNDSGWYMADSVLMKDAANLPFPNALGMPNQVSDALSGVACTGGDRFIVPGIMRVNVITTPGTIGSWNDPVNVAVRDIYSFVRHQNSGSKNYDAADLGVYFYAWDSCATFYAYMVRLYGTVRSLLLRNRYTPEDLVAVMGADYTDITSNLAQFRAYINTFAARIGAMRIPSSLHFIERHMWLFSHIFSDGQTDKSQLYVVNPGAFWEYRTATTPADTKFWMSEKVPMAGALYTFERIVTFGNALLNSVLNSEDFNIMSGDILKAYGDKTFHLNLIAEDYQVPIVYEPEFLLQLHNATNLDIEDSTSDAKAQYLNWYIQQDYSETPNVGALVGNFDVRLKAESGEAISTPAKGLALGLQQPLDVPVENPTPEIVAIATRMKVFAIYTSDVNSKKVMRPYAFGTEMVVGVWVYTKSLTTGLLDTKPKTFSMSPMAQSFSVRPLYFNYSSNDISTGVISSAIDVVGSIDNLTMLPGAILFNIHRAALLGMYGLAK